MTNTRTAMVRSWQERMIDNRAPMQDAHLDLTSREALVLRLALSYMKDLEEQAIELSTAPHQRKLAEDVLKECRDLEEKLFQAQRRAGQL